MERGPGPPDALLAALSAAADLVWPRPPGATDPGAADRVHRSWRFSGRWWNRPVPVARARPWAGPGR